MPREAEGLLAVTFNVWVGQPPDQLRHNLQRLVADVADRFGQRPHVIATQETKRFRQSIRGYDAIRVEERGNPEAANTVLFVRRRGVEILREREIDVDGPQWIGPKHGIEHPPRDYPGATVELVDGGRWDVLALHRTPGGPDSRNRASWRAEDRDIADWCHRRAHRAPGRPVVLLGDWNDREAGNEPLGVADLAERIDAVALLKGIDGGLVVNARGRAHELPGKYGSDGHNPVVLDLHVA